MVIDDNQALLQLVQRNLSNHRCQVLTVPNGEKGWALLQETMPDALIMDVMMPELDGWELLQRIRSNPHTQDIPVIVCTVFNNAEFGKKFALVSASDGQAYNNAVESKTWPACACESYKEAPLFSTRVMCVPQRSF